MCVALAVSVVEDQSVSQTLRCRTLVWPEHSGVTGGLVVLQLWCGALAQRTQQGNVAGPVVVAHLQCRAGAGKEM
jgi:hypothetical protein